MKIYLYDVSKMNIEEAQTQVSQSRLEKSLKCRMDMDRRRSLGVEIILNYALKALCEEITTPVTLKVDEYSKPHIVFSEADKRVLEKLNIEGFNDGTIEFSVSHSGKYVALILADDSAYSVGIDIEKHKEGKTGIATRFFTRTECANISTLERFYVYWTLKESFLKTIGRGLSYGMNKYTVVPEEDLDDKKPHGAIYTEHEFEGDFYGKSFHISPDYSLSICAHNYDVRGILDNSIVFL